MLPDQCRLQIFNWLPRDRDAAGPKIPAVDALIRKFVEGISLPLCPFASNPDIEAIINDGYIDHPLETALMVIADFPAGHRFKLIGRFCSNEVDHACCCVASIQRALRSAQDFRLAEIEKFLLEKMIADKGDVVQRHRDGRIGGDRDSLRAYPTNLNAVTGEVGLCEGKIRHLLHQIRATGGLRGRELLL